MNPCKLREPRVIDNDLLNKCVKEQGRKGEAGRLAELEGIPLEEITEIRLEFLQILKIDHLWVLSSLTRLNLNNNLIEKIENLDTLIHLVELNLSFNRISQIENLDALTKLEKLSFYENKITTMENMDNLTNLTIFSIGRNEIVDMENILYLRRFLNLKSLNMAGNPCAESEDFRLFVAVFLPNLVYYEYRLIYDMERELGHETFSSKLRTLMEKEQTEMEIILQQAQERADAELHALSFVEYLNTRHLFDDMFERDVDGIALLEMGEDAKEFYDEYEEQFLELCNQIFLNGQDQYVLRKAEHEQFLKCVEEAKKQNQEESIKYMEVFLEKKAVMFYEIKQIQTQLNMNDITFEEFIDKYETYVVQYDELLHEVWKALMKLELELYEQMEDVNSTFEQSMTELVNNFVEISQGYFSQIRDLETNYAENIEQLATAFQTNANLNEEIEIAEGLQHMMSDKEILHNSLAASQDLHMQVIDGREDTLISKAREWLENLVDNLSKAETGRNRGKILEVNHFLDIQREEFEDLNSEYVPDIEDEADEESTVM